MVLGVVRIPVWRHFTAEVARRYLHAYHSEGPGHDHIHGANMGFRADAYWRVGGFRALPTGEDVELVERFEAAGMRIHRDAKLSVATSDREAAAARREASRSTCGICGARKRGCWDVNAGLITAMARIGRAGAAAAGWRCHGAAVASAGRPDRKGHRRGPARRGAHRRCRDPG